MVVVFSPPAPIEPATLLQADATVIAGVFIFLTLLTYSGKHDKNIEIKKRLRHPSIIISIFAVSACFALIPILYFPSIILTIGGFAYIISVLAYWYGHPDVTPYYND